jgi:hypothetical protein
MGYGSMWYYIAVNIRVHQSAHHGVAEVIRETLTACNLAKEKNNLESFNPAHRSPLILVTEESHGFDMFAAPLRYHAMSQFIFSIGTKLWMFPASFSMLAVAQDQ